MAKVQSGDVSQLEKEKKKKFEKNLKKNLVVFFSIPNFSFSFSFSFLPPFQ